MKEKLYYAEFSGALADLLRSLAGKKVAVYGHVRPDGDCIGSQVAVVRVLRSLGAEAAAVNNHEVPPACEPFVGDTPFFRDEDYDFTGHVIVTVDCADTKRLGDHFKTLGIAPFLNIDHHISNTNYAEHNLIDGASAATGEILAGCFIDAALTIDPVTAQALYIGIATDTGQFRFSSTTRRTFGICCDLMDRGADPAAAALTLYERESRAKLALLQRFLASFRYECGGRVCIGILDEGDWKATGARKEDTEGLVDYARAIEGVEIGVLLEQREGALKGSFRAKDPRMRVDVVAKRYNGGGHACAAGFNPGMQLDAFYPVLVEGLGEHLRQVNGGGSVAAAENLS
ncbi:MAG: bifunctional oligoribonuclease/PAP phosphatase NrnA [Opitutales bacterium]|nr:bifunctional oligoribonuclease/PAP phosphatase NrnA [Opitutales bacterium]